MIESPCLILGDESHSKAHEGFILKTFVPDSPKNLC
jgi:hypothetical protein